jgi:hypothetical protein
MNKPWRNRVILNGIRCSWKGEMCKMTQAVGSQNAKDGCRCERGTNLGALRSKIGCETNSRRTGYGESVRREIPELWPDNWIFHHDNSIEHQLRVLEFLAKKSITKMDHPPHSPDLVPWNCWLFPKLKNALKDHRFAGIPDIHRNVTLLWDFPENGFQDSFRQRHRCLTNCVASHGEHFDGDSSR